MTSPSHSSDEDFLASLGVSLEDANVTADTDTHASVTGIYARDRRIKLDVGESSVVKISIEIFDHHNPVVAIISPSYLGYLRHFDMDLQIRGCRSVPYSPPEDIGAGKQMTLTAAHTEGIPHAEFILEGDYDEFCRIALMQPIGSWLDSFQRSAPSQPLGIHSSRALGPSIRTPRRRPMTDPTSSTLVEGPSRAEPSCSAGPSRAPQAISEATGVLHPDLANLRLPYSIPYYPPDGTLAFRRSPWRVWIAWLFLSKTLLRFLSDWSIR
ncbi:hypothetical protein JCGZ_06441 [Jatropha curcas]|uniref:Uncharacterized protein n=1 Tax=Jatropha curcas TaxID=180498 RepID=A0A067JLI3_JATCU|nr:hypothetical protein JCGZ_06441 [Jatropha curcas]